MKDIEHVYPIAHRHAADFAAHYPQALTYEQRITAWECFLALEYNHPRPIGLQCLLNRHEDDALFDADIAAAVVEYWHKAHGQT